MGVTGAGFQDHRAAGSFTSARGRLRSAGHPRLPIWAAS